MVATEAAGEGINLQFCWLMVNFDIPWNPVRLEQRVGRIHRYGQEHDCLIFNFVAANTREGRVLEKLLSRLAEIRRELGTDQVFDVVGEVFPSNLLERLFRELYARRLDMPGLEERIVREVNPAAGSGPSPARPWRGSRGAASTCRRSSASRSRRGNVASCRRSSSSSSWRRRRTSAFTRS